MVILYGKLHNGENNYPIFDSETNETTYHKDTTVRGFNTITVGIVIDIFEKMDSPNFIGDIHGYHISNTTNALDILEYTVEDFQEEDVIKDIKYENIKPILRDIEGVFVITGGSYDWEKHKSYENVVLKKVVPGLLENLFKEKVDNIILHDKLV